MGCNRFQNSDDEYAVRLGRRTPASVGWRHCKFCDEPRIVHQLGPETWEFACPVNPPPTTCVATAGPVRLWRRKGADGPMIAARADWSVEDVAARMRVSVDDLELGRPHATPQEASAAYARWAAQGGAKAIWKRWARE